MRIKFLILCCLFFVCVGCEEESVTPAQEISESTINPAEGLAKRVLPVKSTQTVTLMAAPSAMDFGVIVEAEEEQQILALTNMAEAPVTLTELQIVGAQQAFRLEGECAKDVVLKQGEQCHLTLIYAPSVPQIHHGELVVRYKDGMPLKVAMQGEAEARTPLPQDPAIQESREVMALRERVGIAVHHATEGTKEGEITLGEAGYPGTVPRALSTLPVVRSRILTADRYIPAVLENTIHSELPEGRVIAVVERNVYGADGRWVLIPASSRVIGYYSSLKRQGEERLQVTWKRILRPDGVSISIDAKGADAMGRLGLVGNVDSRFAEKYGSSILTSFISVLPEYFTGGEETTISASTGVTSSSSGKNRAGERFSKDMSFLSKRMIEENLHLEPIITIPQGTRLLIVPSEDIYLATPTQFRELPGKEEVPVAVKMPEKQVRVEGKKVWNVKPEVRLYDAEE